MSDDGWLKASEQMKSENKNIDMQIQMDELLTAVKGCTRVVDSLGDLKALSISTFYC